MHKLSLAMLATPLLALCSVQAYADFQSPSGNVVCSTNGQLNPKGGVLCYISQTNNTRPALPKPRNCEFDWGNTFAVNKTGNATMYCVSDYPFDPHPTVLPYGQTLKGKTYECTSLTSGMLCKNTSGHGFMLSKHAQKLF